MKDAPSRFDLAAADWDLNPVRASLARAVADGIRRSVPLSTTWRTLDFGAGTGLVTLGVLPSVREVTALDSSRGMIEELHRKLQAARIANVMPVLGDIFSKSVVHPPFDMVFSSMALHHIEDIPHLLKRFHALLAADGWLALADLDHEGGTFHADPSGVFHTGFDRTQFSAWLHGAGFNGVVFHEAHRLIKPCTDGVEREYSVFLATARRQ